ncbi:uncharacterized protein MICPUCDRAFT_52878 [Micromonas pusilla CCMP1545]|jgi:hypothetical protein|uniref:Predicted protein n=1 Tax=Micromonas pusilla (strain CCMP1545) TaxID=564608 RepID=C1N5B2_MICPC|nr:uncharacterized protein MICPUCDRAFT_52878 [Micromonas pusilla CCMP1545]EEH53080.1 predicted protein [Micromonas pusilla CCMP1545]|eukprot:XP_003063141.1 predicted protein [Micromonas pusilla CCMP1545]
MCHDGAALNPFRGRKDAARMSDEDKFLFDTNGFVVVRGVFGADDLRRFHAAIDAHADRIHERKGQLRLTANRTPLSGDGVTGRKDLAGFLGWETPHREPFRDVLTHPRLLPYLHELVGPGYRLDHNPLLILQDPGSEGFEFHGGSTLDSGEWNHPLGYQFNHGKMRCNLLAFAVHLTDVKEGEGGFCVIRGSHKSNYACPAAIKRYERAVEHAHQPAIDAGDVVVFTEATTHGTLPWRGASQRRNVIYRFSPATNAYGRGCALASVARIFHPIPVSNVDRDVRSTDPRRRSLRASQVRRERVAERVSGGHDGRAGAFDTNVNFTHRSLSTFDRVSFQLTDELLAQRSVMNPPYHPRLNRTVVAEDGVRAIEAAPREKHKVDFDRAVFKQDYF